MFFLFLGVDFKRFGGLDFKVISRVDFDGCWARWFEVDFEVDFHGFRGVLGKVVCGGFRGGFCRISGKVV
jgi:hypothetical protein